MSRIYFYFGLSGIEQLASKPIHWTKIMDKYFLIILIIYYLLERNNICEYIYMWELI